MLADLVGADKPSRASFCKTPAVGVMWRHPDGRYTPVRCGRSNKCGYCSRLAGRETVEAVYLDAKVQMPRHTLTLTTRSIETTSRDFRLAVKGLVRWLRQEHEVEYLGVIEFTTGRSETSGGHRRMHQHALLKGLQAGVDVGSVQRQVSRRMASAIGAPRVELAELRTPEGAIGYMVGHHQKRDQAPPPAWSGKRVRSSRHYWTRPVKEIRADVKTNQQHKVNVHKLLEALQEQGVDPDALEPEQWEHLVEHRAAPQLVQIRQTPRGRPYDVTTGQPVPIDV